VYAIQSREKNYIYVGLSNDFERRINEHNSGYEKTTKPYRPFKTFDCRRICYQGFSKKKREVFEIWSGKEFLKSLNK
jgi:putative endonuclease